MNLEKLKKAKQEFESVQKLCDYNPLYLWNGVQVIFDALLEPATPGDGSIERATDGRITEEPVSNSERNRAYVEAQYPGFLAATEKVVNILKNIAQENSRNVLAEIMADGCDPKPTVNLDFETHSRIPLVDAAEDESQIPAIKRLYQNRRTLGTAPKRSRATRRKGVQ